MRLFQYWDTGQPPGEVAEWIDALRAMNPTMKHRLFDRESASWFIQKHIGARERRAFDACAVPAMQADYFRLCAMLAKGGLWVDADTEPLRPLSELLDSAPQALLPEFNGFFGTMVMFFRQPDNLFLKSFLDLATGNIEARRFSSPLLATGPVLADAMRGVIDPDWAVQWLVGDDPLVITRLGLVDHLRSRLTLDNGLAASYRALTIINFARLMKFVAFREPAYKKTDKHWANWQGSLYSSASADQ